MRLRSTGRAASRSQAIASRCSAIGRRRRQVAFDVLDGGLEDVQPVVQIVELGPCDDQLVLGQPGFVRPLPAEVVLLAARRPAELPRPARPLPLRQPPPAPPAPG